MNQTEPFFLVIADHDRRIFTVEGPMIDDVQWNSAVRSARDYQRHIVCGPSGPDREILAIEYQRANKLGCVPPGSILRPRR